MIKLDDYNFFLPQELIANTPATPRDHARIFVYNTKNDEICFDIFKNIKKYLPEDTMLVLNDTKVLPARLWLKKPTGGKVEVLLMLNEHRPKEILLKGIVDRKIEVGTKLYFASKEFLEVKQQDQQFFYFKPSMNFTELKSLLLKEGHTPIPPYIKSTPLTEHKLRERYQSVFANDGLSVAAPTASLHFTPNLLSRLEEGGIGHTFVTLHVGAGTFAPITDQSLSEKRLFTEFCSISAKNSNSINRALAHGQTIIPVGTTAMRTLESFAEPYSNNYRVAHGNKGTDIFIYPPYEFKIASGLLTNFHVPRSSLMLLVDALLKHKKAQRNIIDLYRTAVEEKFRFYSFGDAMLIL